MQTLGVSPNAPPSEGRLKALLWPDIRTDGDIDSVTRQGFWICIALSVMTLLTGLFGADPFGVATGALFMFVAAIGVRNHSIPAAIAVLVVYLGEKLLLLRLGQNVIGILPSLITCLLIANVRATWLASRLVWPRTVPPPVPLATTFGERFSDVFPIWAWPFAQWLFWLLAALMAFGMAALLFLPAPD